MTTRRIPLALRLCLARLQRAIDAIPGPVTGGTQTASLRGLVTFAADLQIARPYIRGVLNGLILRGHPQLEEGADFEAPDIALATFEAWIAEREKQQWR